MSGNLAICPRAVPDSRGFTLLELLVVVALLATISMIATGTLQGVVSDADGQIVHAEMREIAGAMRRFKQDTGYYPKTGPFNLAAYGGSVLYGDLPDHAGTNDTERDRWFYSPANLYQLLSHASPLCSTVHPLKSWNTETGRGWRGPYLEGLADGYVDIRDGVNADDGTARGKPDGDPLDGDNVPDVDGIADPFDHRYMEIGENTLLDWCRDPRPDRDDDKIRERWGRPYLVFGLGSNPADIRIVSMGPDGTYDKLDPDSDDIQLRIE